MKAIAQTRLVAMIRSDAQRFEALKIRPVTFGGIAVTGALFVAAFHHALQHRSLAEVIQVNNLPFESFKALGIRTDHGDQSGLGDCFHSFPTVYYTVEI